MNLTYESYNEERTRIYPFQHDNYSIILRTHMLYCFCHSTELSTAASTDCQIIELFLNIVF